jgi:hypothetical protein
VGSVLRRLWERLLYRPALRQQTTITLPEGPPWPHQRVERAFDRAEERRRRRG